MMSKWCASCQQEREEGKFCMECGTALTESGSTCVCGYHLKPEAKFCPECGKPVAATESGSASAPNKDSDPLICPVCNSVQDDENWRFCGVCGEKKEVIVLKPPVIQNHPRYAKLGHGGMDLSDDATQRQGWLMTRDKHTGLIWEIKTKDNMDEKYTWDEAQTVFIRRLNDQCFGGFNDWRLPETKELETLIKKGDKPAIDAGWFPFTMSSDYWSSSTLAFDTSYACNVNFNHGLVMYYGKTNSYYVRAVRLGQ